MMKPEEAIKILEVAKAECEWNAPLDYQEAFDMAISALQVQDVSGTNVGDMISRWVAIEAAEKESQIDGAYGYMDTKSITDMLEQLPSAHPEIIRCKDCKYWQDQEEGIVEVPICARPQNKYEKFPLVMLIDGDGFCSYAERRADETY